MQDIVASFIQRGDLAHLALLLWAGGSSAIAWFALRELSAAVRRDRKSTRLNSSHSKQSRMPSSA